MKLVLIVSFLVTALALNTQALQGKVVRVPDGETITILGGTKRIGLRQDANPIVTCVLLKMNKEE